jgi:Fe-S-cluster-containing hydrogenase component 2
MLNKTGIPTKDQVMSRFPKEVLLVKPKAVLECYEPIPCNPCETSCPFGAITIGEDINKQPELDPDRCTGCGICIHSCPGLAIFVSQLTDTAARFKIPYEFLPVPVPGETWIALDRSGHPIGHAKIVKIDNATKQAKTIVVTVDVPKDQLYDFITIRCPYE